MTDHYYEPEDQLTPKQREKMWRAIAGSLSGRMRPFGFIPDLRSFSYGIAASVVIYFSAVGAATTVRNAIAGGAPEAVRLDEAYRSAIGEFERVVPRMVGSRDAGASAALSARADELRKIDAAIADLQALTGNGDLSPLKQKRLRQLYALKLQVLQEMIENGEVEL